MKNFIIGLDGADWRVINPLIERGKMPNIKRLMTESAYGPIKSHIKYGSPALWATIDTGKVPPKHGVKDFFTTTRHHLKSKRLFEILEPAGGKVGLYRWYCTWPPQENQGFTVPSWLTRSYVAYPERYSFLTSLGKSYKFAKLANMALQSLRNGVKVNTLFKATIGFAKARYNNNNLDKIISDNFSSMRMHSEAYIYLLKKFRPNYSAYLVSLIDSIGHRFWKFREPWLYPDVKKEDIKKYGTAIDEAYILSDYYLGKILKTIYKTYPREDVNIIVISDHGQQSVKEQEDYGYFPRTESLLELLKLTDDVSATNIGPHIYIRPKTDTYDVNALKKLFENVKTIKGNDVFTLNDIEQDDMLELNVNKLDDNDHEILVNGKQKIKLTDFASHTDRINGDHAEHGIFIMKSRYVNKNRELNNIYGLEDVTPTVLYLNGKPIGDDMDGRPISEIFNEEFISKRPIEFIKSYDPEDDTGEKEISDEEETEAIKERLKDLGYLS